jgi:hypothetical protein
MTLAVTSLPLVLNSCSKKKAKSKKPLTRRFPKQNEPAYEAMAMWTNISRSKEQIPKR